MAIVQIHYLICPPIGKFASSMLLIQIDIYLIWIETYVLQNLLPLLIAKLSFISY